MGASDFFLLTPSNITQYNILSVKRVIINITEAGLPGRAGFICHERAVDGYIACVGPFVSRVRHSRRLYSRFSDHLFIVIKSLKKLFFPPSQPTL